MGKYPDFMEVLYLVDKEKEFTRLTTMEIGRLINQTKVKLEKEYGVRVAVYKKQNHKGVVLYDINSEKQQQRVRDKFRELYPNGRGRPRLENGPTNQAERRKKTGKYRFLVNELVELLESQAVWVGTAADLMEYLNYLCEFGEKEAQLIPQRPHEMGKLLKKLEQDLFDCGVVVEMRRTMRDKVRYMVLINRYYPNVKLVEIDKVAEFNEIIKERYKTPAPPKKERPVRPPDLSQIDEIMRREFPIIEEEPERREEEPKRRVSVENIVKNLPGEED